MNAPGTGLPNMPATTASRLSPLLDVLAPRHAVGAPSGPATAAPRSAPSASPIAPSAPGAVPGTQSSGSLAVAGPSASIVQSSHSCAGSSGQSVRSRHVAAIVATAARGGAIGRAVVAA